MHDDADWVRALVTRLTDRHEQARADEPGGHGRSRRLHRQEPAPDRRRRAPRRVGRGQGQAQPEPLRRGPRRRRRRAGGGRSSSRTASSLREPASASASPAASPASAARSGVRVVVGRWDESPWGGFADVMVEDAAGHRVLLAPVRARAGLRGRHLLVRRARHRAGGGRATPASGWRVVTPSLSLCWGRWSYAAGCGLGLVPAPCRDAPAWCAVIDPVARLVLRGVRTRGTAGKDRREWYGATSVVEVTAI